LHDKLDPVQIGLAQAATGDFDEIGLLQLLDDT
jgi:hypothetical protein